MFRNVCSHQHASPQHRTDDPTCHFRHPGLKLGLPPSASRSRAKIYRLGTLPLRGPRRGSSLASYTSKGTFSNSAFTGLGMLNRSFAAAVLRAKADCDGDGDGDWVAGWLLAGWGCILEGRGRDGRYA